MEVFSSITKNQSKQIIPAFKIASQLVTNSDYLEFIDAGGYENPDFWLSDGWNHIIANNIKHPLYWSQEMIFGMNSH